MFLSQGKLFDENNVEFLYEEFCYKQYKINSHNNDGESSAHPSVRICD